MNKKTKRIISFFILVFVTLLLCVSTVTASEKKVEFGDVIHNGVGDQNVNQVYTEGDTTNESPSEENMEAQKVELQASEVGLITEVVILIATIAGLATAIYKHNKRREEEV